MRGLLRLSPVMLAALALTGCATSQRKPVVFEDESWTYRDTAGHKLTTPHYEIYTTIQDPVLLHALPDFVESAFAHYQQLMPPTREPEERMKTYLFASRGQWVSFTKSFTQSRAGVFLKVRNGGYTERGVAVIEYVAHSITFPLFAHEGFHQYLYHYVNATSVPAWLNEGLAVVSEGQRWGNQGLTEFDPWYNPARRNVLSQALIVNHLHSLRRLLETNAGEVINGTSESVSVYYAQLWGLVLFLREGEKGQYNAGFQKLLTALSRPDAEQHARAAYIWSDRQSFNFGEDLFRSFISDDLAAVEREYFAFMREKFLGTH